MRRDTVVFTLAGAVFGFLAGYMAAGWDTMPSPAVATATTPVDASVPAPADLERDDVQALEAAAARQPHDAAVRIQLGNLLMDHEFWDDAIRWYRDALAIVPDNSDVATDMGACYVHSGRPAEGLAVFDRVLERDPDHRNARFNRGVALLDLGRMQEAADTWDELLKRHPGDAQLQRLRARIREIRTRAAAGGGQPIPAGR